MCCIFIILRDCHLSHTPHFTTSPTAMCSCYPSSTTTSSVAAMAFTVSDQASILPATAGQIITCKAAVAYEVDTPLSFEDIHVAPPGPTEVRIQVTHAAVCQSDLYYLRGKDRGLLFPRIMGHEGAGIVESVGSAITDLKPGDKVIPVWQAECQKCPRCLSGRSNICDVFLQQFDSGVMRSDQTSRFSRVADGKPIFHFFGTSVFSQYTVLDEACVAKINPNADLSKVCLLGCGVSTGIGSAWNIAKVTPNSSVAVFGLGTIGLAVVEGAKIAGASRIIGIDRLESKLKKGKDFGLTDTLNTSSAVEKSIQEIIRGMTNEGVDFSFDCTGNPTIISAAMECCRPDGGVAVILGLVDSRKLISFHPSSLLLGKTWTSGLFGGYKARTHLPGLVEKCIDGVINLDQYVTHNMPFSEINKAVQLLDEGECLRCIMDYDS